MVTILCWGPAPLSSMFPKFWKPVFRGNTCEQLLCITRFPRGQVVLSDFDWQFAPMLSLKLWRATGGHMYPAVCHGLGLALYGWNERWGGGIYAFSFLADFCLVSFSNEAGLLTHTLWHCRNCSKYFCDNQKKATL